ncbi:MAG: hypothetical protein ACK5A3_13925, partial [Planctomyces sp.]
YAAAWMRVVIVGSDPDYLVNLRGSLVAGRGRRGPGGHGDWPGGPAGGACDGWCVAGDALCGVFGVVAERVCVERVCGVWCGSSEHFVDQL